MNKDLDHTMKPLNKLEEELVGQNAALQRMTDRLAKEKQYAVELKERTKEIREILSETLSVKLKYEEIINQVIEGEKFGMTRPIWEIIRSTPAPMSTALKAVNDLLPDLRPTSPIKKTPRKRQSMNKMVRIYPNFKANPAEMPTKSAILLSRKSITKEKAEK